MSVARERTGFLLELARGQGFALRGVAPLGPSEHARAYRAWIGAGKHGEMRWLEKNTETRLDPGTLIEGGARWALMVADLYATRATEPEETVPAGHGRVARYARGRDYHKVMKKRLHALADAARGRFGGAWRAFVDTAPVLERELAQRAGIGWTGKHTLTIHPRAGSWMLLGGLATTLELEVPSDQEPVSDHCGSCTRCIDACPTDAITPYSVDATRCIAYLTIEHRSEIDPDLHAPMGDWLFGCDVCQAVCPHNSVRDADALGEAWREPSPGYGSRAASLDLLEVLGWDEGRRRECVSGTPMTRADLGMLRRNAAIVAGNAPDPDGSLGRALGSLAGDEGASALARRTARVVLARRGAEDKGAGAGDDDAGDEPEV